MSSSQMELSCSSEMYLQMMNDNVALLSFYCERYAFVRQGRMMIGLETMDCVALAPEFIRPTNSAPPSREQSEAAEKL